MRLIEGKAFYNKPWYNSYRCMMSRCYRAKDVSYKFYGGRGIKVCDEWHDIQRFEEWVERHPFENGMTLDRIDTNADYSPANCRWATKHTQANNRRNTVKIEWRGKTHTISEWADILGINRSTLSNRYWRGDRGDKLFEERRYKCLV